MKPIVISFSAALLLALFPICSYAESFRIEFSGKFDACNNCEKKPTENLVGKDFRGVLEVMNDGSITPELLPSLSPLNAQRALYKFKGRSFFSFTSSEDRFDVSKVSPVDVLISYCKDLLCPIQDNFLRLGFSEGPYWYLVTLGLPTSPFESTKIPPNNQLREMTAYVQVFSEDLSEEVSAGFDRQRVLFEVSNKLLGTDNDIKNTVSPAFLPASLLLFNGL
jgi:hypothetical protein